MAYKYCKFHFAHPKVSRLKTTCRSRSVTLRAHRMRSKMLQSRFWASGLHLSRRGRTRHDTKILFVSFDADMWSWQNAACSTSLPISVQILCTPKMDTSAIFESPKRGLNYWYFWPNRIKMMDLLMNFIVAKNHYFSWMIKRTTSELLIFV